jgi:error-prone DNA polymerase
MSNFAELGVTSNYSFLHGAAHPREFIERAATLGYAAIGIADRNTLAGVVRAYAALEEMKRERAATSPLRLLVGCRLVFADGTPDILAYPKDRAAYGRLCRLLSLGKIRAAKGECRLMLEDLLQWHEGLLLVVMPPHPLRKSATEKVTERFWNEGEVEKVQEKRVRSLSETLRHLKPFTQVWLGLSMPHYGDDELRLQHLKDVAEQAGVALLATNDALYHIQERRELQDVLVCIREHKTLDTAGRMLEMNAERHLKSPDEMQKLFRLAPETINATINFASQITFTLDQLKYNYPDEPVPKGTTAQAHLEDITWQGANKRYPAGIADKLRATLEKELKLISKMDIAHYFLTVHDIVSYARSINILCQGRGSAANSAVCYALGITAVDPMQIDLLFERFVSEERKEPPDIDVDFEHERREEVIQNIYARYGKHRAALAATVVCYRPRSAIREVGKVFGLTDDVTARLASGVWGSWGRSLKERDIRQGEFDPGNKLLARACTLANELIGFPRHLSQHVGGFVLTQDRLDETVPIGPATMEDRYFIEWDKDDIDVLRIMKVDVLALGILTCIRKAFDLIRIHEGKAYELATVPREDPAVYEMLQKADSIGVFQVESRAQMSMLPRLKPKNFYDLVIEVALVRPGPIQGDMVHPYLRRRSGKEKVEFPSPSPEHGHKDELRHVLGRTMGVPLFQEQAMKLAIVAAQFTPDEANGLRRAMATFRNLGKIDLFKEKFVSRMIARGYEPEFAARCFKQIEGFGSYGFPESHSASFAHLVYISAWLKKHHPAAFCCAILNSQPMGFYAPGELVRDAREHGVEVLPVDVNASAWDNLMEFTPRGELAVRLGFRQVNGFHEKWAISLCAARGNGYRAVADMARRLRLSKRALIILAEADSFQSISKDRREILWAVRRIPDDDALPLFAAQFVEEQPHEEDIAALPLMPQSEHVVADYQMVGLSLRKHLMFFLREMFAEESVMSCAEIAAARDGVPASCAGVVLTRQMPGGSGVVFATLSDETGICNVVVWPRLVEVFRREIMGARLMLVEGVVQRSEEGVVHLVARRIYDRSTELARLTEDEVDAPSLRSQAARSPTAKHPRDVRTVPKSRDFH